MRRDFAQVEWDRQTEDDCRQLVRLAVREDLSREQDLTTLSLVPQEARGAAVIVARKPGLAAGLAAARTALDEMQADLTWTPNLRDGDPLENGTELARLQGSVRDLLTCERTILNFLGRLCGVATLTRQYVSAVAGTKARIYDTRKTTPGWRRLEKYAVRLGGGTNHRTGLFDAVLIKDNHLAQAGLNPREAVEQARRFLLSAGYADTALPIVEIEVDTLDQFQLVLPARPDIVLLDNMSLEQLREAVALRDRVAPQVELEASGGIQLSTIRGVAETGVERISVGALTHSATNLDLGLDWLA
jgi:nicotinate-nucleotide pyrophosphorylase (carboxylating)